MKIEVCYKMNRVVKEKDCLTCGMFFGKIECDLCGVSFCPYKTKFSIKVCPQCGWMMSISERENLV